MSTTTRPYVTPHAFRRWHERFGGNIFPALNRAIPFGGQLGDQSKMLIDKITGAVFVVKSFTAKSETVVTVLTEQLATANIQAGCKRVRWYHQPKPAAAVAAALKAAGDHDRLDQIRRIARSHVRDYGTKNGMTQRKRRLDELRAAGFDPASPDGKTYAEFVKLEMGVAYG